ncbi:MAG: nucleotidyltransferase domain-containing protein [Chloroflexi bacterium]|nr:nucleotidyltransferase domain-containing protein [Chloroflexota bacterium]
MGPKELATSNEILRGLVGSTVHGVSVKAQDDRDEMGICIEPPDYVVGLNTFQQYVYRTQPEGARSGPGDLDLVIYSLRKYVRLAGSGNPTVILLLFVPEQELVVKTPLGDRLRAASPLFASREAAARYVGYLQSQRRPLIGEGGRRNLPNRPELVAQYGFDTKYAGHMVRLGFQGIEFLRTGRLTLPMPEPERTYVRDVRLGKYSLPAILKQAEDLERQLQELSATAPLPERPDWAKINQMLYEMHMDYWAGKR